jgi:hypothetical protein
MAPIISRLSSLGGGGTGGFTFGKRKGPSVAATRTGIYLWELDLRNTTCIEWSSNTTFSSSDTGYDRYGFNLGGSTVYGLLQNHDGSGSSTAKVPITFSTPRTKIFFITWYYKSSFGTDERGGYLSTTPTLFGTNYTIHPGGVYRNGGGGDGDGLVFETSAGTSDFQTAAGTRYTLSAGMSAYASGWHSLAFMFDSSSTSVPVYINGTLRETLTHNGTFGNFTGARLAAWNDYGSGYSVSNACMSYSMAIDGLNLTSGNISTIHSTVYNNLSSSSTRLSTLISI